MGWTAKCFAVSFASVVLSVAPACTEQVTPTDAAAAAIIGGEADTTRQAVVKVYRTAPDGDYSCSGTIFATQPSEGVGWILTAAHCVLDAEELVPPPSAFSVVQGNDSADAKTRRTYAVTAVAKHPNWKRSADSHDLAVLKVKGVTASTPVIQLISKLADDPRVGDEVTLVGYGRVKDVGLEDGNEPYRKQIDKTLSYVSTMYVSVDQETDGARRGDSGGPVLIGTPEGVRVLATSSYTQPPGEAPSCLGTGLSSRVGPATGWIAGVVSGEGGLDTPTCNECIAALINGGGACAEGYYACYGDPDCNAYMKCRSGCTRLDCTETCGEAHPLWTTYDTCIEERCPAYCPPKCGFFGGHAACDACRESECCAEELACNDDEDCRACRAGSTPSDGSFCAKNEAYAERVACRDTNCAAQCKHVIGKGSTDVPPPADAGGAGGSAGASGASGSATAGAAGAGAGAGGAAGKAGAGGRAVPRESQEMTEDAGGCAVGRVRRGDERGRSQHQALVLVGALVGASMRRRSVMVARRRHG